MHFNFRTRFSSAATSILILSHSSHGFARGGSLAPKPSLVTTSSTSASTIVSPSQRIQSLSTQRRSTTVTTAMSSISLPEAISVQPGTSPVESQETINPIDETCTVLVVGATRGIGLEFVQQCVDRGASVFATHRSELSSSSSLERLKDQYPNKIHFLKMDIADEESIKHAALEYESKYNQDHKLTHIIHNAGIYPTGSSFDGTARGPRQAAPPVTKEIMMKTFEINTIAPLLVAQHFVPLLSKRSDTLLPVLSFLSSKVGSVDDNGSGGAYSYRSSKSALNNIAKSLSIDLGGQVSVVLLHPGYVRTDMTDGNGLIDTDESVTGMLKAIEATDVTVGFRFVDFKACLIPW